jgi:hypothetical protein
MTISKKISILVGGLVLVTAFLSLAVGGITLSNISSNIFFAGYILSVIFASIIVGIAITPTISYVLKSTEYDKKYKQLKSIENDNRIDINFTSEAKDLNQNLVDNKNKIKELKRKG